MKEEINLKKNSFLFNLLVLGALIWAFFPILPHSDSGADLALFSRFPVLQEGRVKPLDTVARSSLLVLSHKESVSTKGQELPASKWLLDLVSRPEVADMEKVFCIDNLDVLGFLNLPQTAQRYFSFNQIAPSWDRLEKKANSIEKISAKSRSSFESALLEVEEQVVLYQRLKFSLETPELPDSLPNLLLKNPQSIAKDKHLQKELSGILTRSNFIDQSAYFWAIPVSSGNQYGWISSGKAIGQLLMQGTLSQPLLFYHRMEDARKNSDPAAFNAAANSYNEWLQKNLPSQWRWSRYEEIFNAVSPFWKGIILYFIVFISLALSWVVAPERLMELAMRLLVVAWSVHSFGILCRIIIQGRPPVTNLYSSAVFIGWVAVLLCWILERKFPKGFAAMTASIIGFTTLIIAHHLAMTGDTMEMMRAVLNSNFWLSTHVSSITIGYASTFVAGTLGILYILKGVLTPSLDKEAAKALVQMTYGIICFSLFFSFVGTVLGGIWADQSWGRFWGWDPKENGALLIVLWNAIILHARWGGFIRERGLMVMAVLGNVITSLSWFGVNMLGIGLHSYGWMDKAFFWLSIFILSQLAIAALGGLPLGYWKSKLQS